MSFLMYGVGYFLSTLLIQYILHKVRKNKNKQHPIWAGISPVIVIAFLGILNQDITYLGAVVGYAAADIIGENMDWH